MNTFSLVLLLVSLVLTVGTLISNIVRKNAQSRLTWMPDDTDEELELIYKVKSKMFTSEAFLNIQLVLLAVCLIVLAAPSLFISTTPSTPVTPTISPTVTPSNTWDYKATTETGDTVTLTVTGYGGECFGEILAGDSQACAGRRLEIDSHGSKVWIEGRSPEPEITPDPDSTGWVGVISLVQINKLDEYSGIKFSYDRSYIVYFLTEKPEGTYVPDYEFAFIYHDLTLAP